MWLVESAPAMAGNQHPCAELSGMRECLPHSPVVKSESRKTSMEEEDDISYCPGNKEDPQQVLSFPGTRIIITDDATKSIH